LGSDVIYVKQNVPRDYLALSSARVPKVGVALGMPGAAGGCGRAGPAGHFRRREGCSMVWRRNCRQRCSPGRRWRCPRGPGKRPGRPGGWGS